MAEEDSFERRRREREERRRKREEEMKREEEEMERAREKRRQEREERRRQREKEEAEELERIASKRTPRREEKAEEDKSAEEEKKKQKEEEERREREKKEEEEKKRKEEEEKEAAERRERQEQERKAAEEADAEAAAEREREERRKRREEERKQKEAEEAEEEARREKEREERRKQREAEKQEEDDRARKQKEKEEAEEREREEERERRRRRREEEEAAAAAEEAAKAAKAEASSSSSSSSASNDAEVEELRSENKKLKAENKELSNKVEDLTNEADSVRKMLTESQQENESLKKEIEKLKAAAAAGGSSSGGVESVGHSAAPRLTGTTRSRPTKSGRRGQTRRASTAASDDLDDDASGSVAEEEKKPAPRATGNKAADLLAATMRGAMSGSKGGLRKVSGGNVFVSAGTKGGEISRCLFQLKGKTRIRAVRVQDSPKSFTQKDVFILETKTHIWTYIGKNSNRLKIARALDVVGKMQRQRGQARAAILETVDNKSQYDDSVDRLGKKFWAEFEEGEPSEIPEGEDDTQWEQDYEAKTNLFLVNSGFDLELIGQGKLKQEDLESDKIFLLDTPNEMFVWCGRGSDVEERREAVEQAQAMLDKTIADGLKAPWVTVERVAERGEGALFEDKFFKWSDSMRKIIGKVPHKANSNVAVSDAAKKQELPRIKMMHDGILEEPKEYTDDLDGEPEITVVKDFRRTPVDKKEYGIFYSKQCYIILYKYDDTGVFYYWIGKDAGVTETGSAASLTKEWAGECGLNRPNLVRVDQGKEPKHFLQLFKGKMLAYIGESGSEVTRTKSLFHIRGTDAGNTRSFECPDINGAYLNSDDAFVLNTKENQYVWIGEHANKFLAGVADHIAGVVAGSRSSKTLREGSESSDFKKAVEWVDDYAKHEERPNDLPYKLFICTNHNKQYRADQVYYYVQSDLSHGNQAILDRYHEVIVWLGRDTKAADKKIALEVAVDYVEKAEDGRKDCHVWVIDEGEEVVDFTRYFQAWDMYKIRSSKKHITQRSPMMRRDSSLAKAMELLSGSGGGQKYPLKKLLDRDYLPTGVDKKTLENFLQDSDFPEAFGCTAKEFWALPKWKQLQKKKASPLF